ncbi:hypothetical protein [Treponema pedis]|uniref:hypothetical protein n=1 Tax=Treponema pedis TaxID=409322 RepID=UPI00041B743E|nr:hypothetical protein [Treponema pedis]
MFGKRSGAVYTEKASRVRELTLGTMHPRFKADGGLRNPYCKKIKNTGRCIMPQLSLYLTQEQISKVEHEARADRMSLSKWVVTQ